MVDKMMRTRRIKKYVVFKKIEYLLITIGPYPHDTCLNAKMPPKCQIKRLQKAQM